MNPFKILREEVGAIERAVNKEHEKLRDAANAVGETLEQGAEKEHDNAPFAIQMDIVRTQSTKLRQLLGEVNNMEIVDGKTTNEQVTLGSMVKVRIKSIGEMCVKIGGYGAQYMADAQKGEHGYKRISYLSALGNALLGKKKGETFTYKVGDNREMGGKVEDIE